jgi:hypothetical protein
MRSFGLDSILHIQLVEGISTLLCEGGGSGKAVAGAKFWARPNFAHQISGMNLNSAVNGGSGKAVVDAKFWVRPNSVHQPILENGK